MCTDKDVDGCTQTFDSFGVEVRCPLLVEKRHARLCAGSLHVDEGVEKDEDVETLPFDSFCVRVRCLPFKLIY